MSNDLKIFVGNLPFTATSEDLKNLFQKYGTVVGINLRKGCV
jgi:RNA recognition motif-containing protein